MIVILKEEQKEDGAPGVIVLRLVYQIKEVVTTVAIVQYLQIQKTQVNIVLSLLILWI